jgi:hypothetical protein
VTTAVPASLITGGSKRRALCPNCVGGRLHPYKLIVDLGGVDGYAYGTAWVAVCEGSSLELAEDMGDVPVERCGFSVPLTPHRSEALRPAPTDTAWLRPMSHDE